MNTDTGAPTSAILAALCLVPLVIICLIAIAAVKFSDRWPSILQCLQNKWKASTFRKPPSPDHRFRHSIRADSWEDLESAKSHKLECTSDADTPRTIWRPSRSSRLRWCFLNPKISHPDHSESQNLQRPLPVARRHARWDMLEV